MLAVNRYLFPLAVYLNTNVFGFSIKAEEVELDFGKSDEATEQGKAANAEAPNQCPVTKETFSGEVTKVLESAMPNYMPMLYESEYMNYDTMEFDFSEATGSAMFDLFNNDLAETEKSYDRILNKPAQETCPHEFKESAFEKYDGSTLCEKLNMINSAATEIKNYKNCLQGAKKNLKNKVDGEEDPCWTGSTGWGGYVDYVPAVGVEFYSKTATALEKRSEANECEGYEMSGFKIAPYKTYQVEEIQHVDMFQATLDGFCRIKKTGTNEMLMNYGEPAVQGWRVRARVREPIRSGANDPTSVWVTLCEYDGTKETRFANKK